MIEVRPQVKRSIDRFLRWLLGTEDIESRLEQRLAADEELYGKNEEELVFGVATEEEYRAMMQRFRSVAKKAKVQIRHHLERYQDFLERAQKAGAIDRRDYVLDAKDEKIAVTNKKQIYEDFSKRYFALRKAWMKWKQVQMREEIEEEFDFSFGDIDLYTFREKMEEESEQRQLEQQHVEEFEREVDLLGQDAEVDATDVEKDLDELEESELSDVFEDMDDDLQVFDELDEEEEREEDEKTPDDWLTEEDL